MYWTYLSPSVSLWSEGPLLLPSPEQELGGLNHGGKYKEVVFPPLLYGGIFTCLECLPFQDCHSCSLGLFFQNRRRTFPPFPLLLLRSKEQLPSSKYYLAFCVEGKRCGGSSTSLLPNLTNKEVVLETYFSAFYLYMLKRSTCLGKRNIVDGFSTNECVIWIHIKVLLGETNLHV